MYLHLSFQSSFHIKITIPSIAIRAGEKLNADLESVAQTLSNLHISLLNEFFL
jgi:MFS superfamily sulfate permease-like transporter